MDNAGCRALDRTGRRIDQGNGFGYRPPVGLGLPANRGVGRPITTVGGLTFRDLDGRGYPALAPPIAAMGIGIITGVRPLFTSSTAPRRVETMLGGIRWHPENAGADTIIVEETTARI